MKHLAFCYNTYRRDRVRDRNLPGPAALDGQEVDVNIVCCFRIFPTLHIFEPAMDGILVENFIVLFQVQLASQKRLATASIHYDPGGYVDLLPGELGTNPDGPIVYEVDPLHLYTLVHLGAQTLGMLEQQQVKFAPVDMIGMVTVNPLLAKFREVQGLLLAIEIAPRSTKLLGEACLIHLVDQPELTEDSHRGEDQRLTDVRPWLVMAF